MRFEIQNNSLFGYNLEYPVWKLLKLYVRDIYKYKTTACYHEAKKVGARLYGDQNFMIIKFLNEQITDDDILNYIIFLNKELRILSYGRNETIKI